MQPILRASRETAAHALCDSLELHRIRAAIFLRLRAASTDDAQTSTQL
jgi:hypothetical protein